MRQLRGPALLALAAASEALSAFAVGVLVARDGGPGALGRLATAMALLLAGVTATELGQNVVLTRRTASGEGSARRGFGASLLVKAAGSILLAPAVVLLWPADEPGWGSLAALANMLLSSGIISATAVLRGRSRFGRVALASAVSALFALAGVLFLRPVSLSAVLAVLALAQAAKAAVVFGSLPVGSEPERPRREDLRALLAETLPFAGVVGVGVLYFKADVVLLSAIAGAAEAGRYAAAARLIEALKLLPTALGAALFPALAAGNDRELRRAAGSAAALGAAVIVLASAMGEQVLRALFGHSFATAAAPLRVLSVTFLLASLNALLILTLYARREERAVLRALALALALNLVVNLLLIPRHGALGAAAASAISEAVLASLYLRALRAPRPATELPGLIAGPLLPRGEPCP